MVIFLVVESKTFQYDKENKHKAVVTMTSLTFDSLASAQRLRSKGISQEHAEAFAEELRASKDVDISHLATKEELNTFKSELRADLRSLESEIKNTEARLEAKIAEGNVKIMMWMFGGFISLGGLLAAILFKLH